MAFVGATATSFQDKMRNPTGPGQALPPEASLGARCPTLEISCQVHRVSGTLSEELHAVSPTHSTMCFPVDHTSEQISHPRKGRVSREELGTWGLDGVPATVL